MKTTIASETENLRNFTVTPCKELLSPKAAVKNLTDRPWQEEAVSKLAGKRFALISAPGGSGKSTVQVALAVLDSAAGDQKQLILVPQQHIALGFTHHRGQDGFTIVIGGVEYFWKVRHNFCDESSKIVDKLMAWLVANSTDVGLAAVATHNAMALAWEKLSDAQRKRAINHLTLRPDESHHACGVFDNTDASLTEEQKKEMEEGSTKLGEICRFVFNSGVQSAKICFSTATHFRGDRRHITYGAAKAEFVTYYRPFSEHFKTLNLDTFEYGTIEFEGTPYAALLEQIGSEPAKRHLVVIPATGDKWRKPESLGHLMEAIYSISWVKKDRVLDLVSPEKQVENLELLHQEPKSVADGESRFDVVISCMLVREGTDWVPCDRLHNTACEASITQSVQTFYRPFRAFEAKKDVRIFNYVQRVPRENIRELVSTRLNQTLVAMELSDLVHPILVSASKRRDSSNGQERTPVREVFGDQFQTIVQQLLERVDALERKDKNERGISLIIDSILDEYGITDNRRGVKRALLAYLLRAWQLELRFEDLDVDALLERGFDKVAEAKNLAGRSILLGEIVPETDMKRLRECLLVASEYWVKFAEELVANNPGKIFKYKDLPPPLVAAAYRRPEMFAHLKKQLMPRFRTLKKSKYWVKFGEELVANNPGKIFTSKELSSSGLSGLSSQIMKKPELFAHLRKQLMPGRLKSPEYWVKFGEELVANNPRKIFGARDLPCGLRHSIQKHPELFTHLRKWLKPPERRWVRRSTEDWVKDAEKLVADNPGKVFQSRGISETLRRVLNRHPEKFMHLRKWLIPQSPAWKQ